MATGEEQLRAQQAKLAEMAKNRPGSRIKNPVKQKKTKAPKTSKRLVSGNTQNASLIDKLKSADTAKLARKGRAGLHAAAEGAGKVTVAAAQEAGGVAKAFGTGAAKQAGLDKAAKAGASRASQVGTALKGSAKSLGKKALGLVGKTAGGLGLAAGAADTAFNRPLSEFPEAIARTNPITAPFMAGLDKVRGVGPIDSIGRTFSSVAGGALGDAPNPIVKNESLPDFANKSLVDLGVEGFNKLTAPEPVVGEGIRGARVPSQGVPGSNLLNPNRTQAAPGGAGAGAGAGGAGGAPTPGVRQFVDRGVLPPSGTGFVGRVSTVDEQGNRIADPETAARGLRAIGTPRTPEQQAATQTPAAPAQTQNEELTQKLADQARGGGIASAFGAIASGGNVLREQAANRSRQAQQQSQQAELKNNLDIAIQKSTAGLGAEQQDQAFKQQRARFDALAAAEEAGNEQAAARERSGIFQAGIKNIDGPDGATAGVLASQELNKFIQEKGVLDLLGLGPGRNLYQVITESEEPQVSLNPNDTVYFDRASGELRQRSQVEGKDDQKIVDLSATSADLQDFLRATGIIRDQKGNFASGGQQARGAFR